MAVSTTELLVSFFLHICNQLFTLLTSGIRIKMTTRMNFSIVIVIFIVCLSYSPSICKENKSRPRKSIPDHGSTTRKSITSTSDEGVSWRQEETVCGRGNAEKNATCIPKCSESVNNGNYPGICNCTKSHGKDSYDETLICLTAQPNHLKCHKKLCECRKPEGSQATTQMGPSKNSTHRQKKAIAKNESPEWPWKCLPKCDSITVFKITRLGNTTYCWTPIRKGNVSDSPCNAGKINYLECLIYYKYIVGGAVVVGIIFLAMVICICCIVRRRRKRTSTKENVPLESKYPEYMEDNAIYS